MIAMVVRTRGYQRYWWFLAALLMGKRQVLGWMLILHSLEDCYPQSHYAFFCYCLALQKPDCNRG